LVETANKVQLDFEKKDMNVKVYNPKDWSLQDFEIGMPIGKGGFGKVYLARTKNEHFVCALKKIKKNSISIKYSHLIAREIEIQRQLNHKNILKLYAFFWDSNNIYLVMEWAPDGDLFKKMQDQVIRLLTA
jgi:serine/threonine protein kinase